MAHEDRRLLVRRIRRHEALDLALQEQIARKSKDPTQFRRIRDAGHQTHGSTLAETTEDDSLCWNAALDLVLNQCVEDLLTPQNARLVFTSVRQVAEVCDVIPARHAHPHVDRNGDVWGVGEDEFGLGEHRFASELFGEEGPGDV